MRFVRDANEKGATVVLDGHAFINCKFTECKLLYAGGDYAWDDSVFLNCQLVFKGTADRTVLLLRSFGLYDPSAKPAQVPVSAGVN